MKFAFTLDRTTFHKSIYCSAEAYEVVNPQALNGFIKNEMGIKFHKQGKFKHMPYANEQVLIQKYRSKLREGKMPVTYNMARHKWGRIIPDGSLSLSLFHRPTRHSLCQDYYVDFDMVNAQPSVINQVCLQNGIANKSCMEYCKDPKNTRYAVAKHHELKHITNKETGVTLSPYEQAKKLFLSLSFGGSYNEWKKTYNAKNEDMGEILEMEAENKIVMDTIYKLNPDMLEDANNASDSFRRKSIAEKKRSIMGLWGQTMERMLQENCIYHLCENLKFDLNAIVPCQDGFMVLKSELERVGYITADDHALILKGMSNEIQRMWDFDIAWEVKPFDGGIKGGIPLVASEIVDDIAEVTDEEIPDTVVEVAKENKPKKEKKPKKSYKEQYSEIMENSKKEEDLFDCTVADDDHASSLIYKSIKNKLVFCKAQLYYKTDMSLWITDPKIIKSLICVCVANAHFTKLTATGNEITFSGNLCNQRNVADCVINLAIQKRDDTWIDKWNSSSVGKMLFNNGYYDFVEKTFIKRDSKEFDNTVIFNNITGYDFEACIDTVYLAKIQKAVFTDALGDEVGDFMKQKIARALSGEIMKEASCIFGIGSGNAGKSFIGRILKKCAGSYIGNFNGNNLSHKKNENNDEAQALRWVKLLSDKRIIISQELGQNNKLNGEIIKKLTGGDVLTARGHGENETDFYFQGLILAYCNDTPNIMPYDDACAFRTRVAEYNNSFVANPNPNDIFQKQLDMTLDAESQTEKFACAFMTLLFQSYHAERVNSKIESMIATAKQQFEGEDGNIMDTLLGNYKFTGDSEDSVASADITELFKHTSFSMNKISTEIKKYCICNNIEGVCSKKKRMGQKTYMHWFGVRCLQENEMTETANPQNI